MEGRNALIDLLKLIFAFIVMYHHLRPNTICGYLAVDFFFIVSGYLMVVHCRHHPDENSPRYIGHKFMSFFPYLFVAEIFSAIIYATIQFGNGNIIEGFEAARNQLLNITCLSMLGLFDADVTWYLSAMMLASAIIYPILRHGGTTCSKVILPILGLASMIFALASNGKINYSSAQILGPICQGLFRGFADMCFGVFAYEFARELDKRIKVNSERRIITVVEIISYIAVFLIIAFYDTSGPRELIEFLSVILIWLGVTITMSCTSLTYFMFCDNEWLKKNSGHIAKLSLLIYLNHRYVKDGLRAALGYKLDTPELFAVVLLTFVMCALCYVLGRKVDYVIRRDIINRIHF